MVPWWRDSRSTINGARIASPAARIWIRITNERWYYARGRGGADGRCPDARLTRVEQQLWGLEENGVLLTDLEEVGIGVRVMVNGYWGFAASPFLELDPVARLARDAVAQAKEGAKGPLRPMELGRISVVSGTWSTPVMIDPFAVTLEEKRDFIRYWKTCADRLQIPFYLSGIGSGMSFFRQQRVVATSEGSVFAQTLYESSGDITLQQHMPDLGKGSIPTIPVHGLDVTGKGWELFLENLPDQFPQLKDELDQQLRECPTCTSDPSWSLYGGVRWSDHGFAGRTRNAKSDPAGPGVGL